MYIGRLIPLLRKVKHSFPGTPLTSNKTRVWEPLVTVVEPEAAFPAAAAPAVLTVATAAVVAVAEGFWWCFRGAAAVKETMHKKREKDCMVFMLIIKIIESMNIKYEYR